MKIADRQRNSERVLSALQACSPMSRAEISESTGISYPTISRIISDLLCTEVVCEREDAYSGMGRPRKIYELASKNRFVVGLVLSPVRCEVVIGGCDGSVRDESTRFFTMPQKYEDLLDEIVRQVNSLKAEFQFQPLGLGLTTPGQIDRHDHRMISCPNIPQLIGHQIGEDLTGKLGVQTSVVQCMHGAFLAERLFGAAKEIDNFVLMTHSGGIGIAVCSHGKLMQGVGGVAGEFGHIVVAPEGGLCGCGNRGCLETVASDNAVAKAVSKKTGRQLDLHEAIRLLQSGELEADEILNSALGYLATGVSSLINIFNPEAVFLYGYLWNIAPELFEQFKEQVAKRTLKANYEQCRLIVNQGRPQIVERRGAIAALVHQLTLGHRQEQSAAGI